MAVSVELAPEVLEVLAALGAQTQRQLRNAVSHSVNALARGDLEGRVRPWDLARLRHGSKELGEVTAARAVQVDGGVLMVEVLSGGQRLVFRRVDDGWRLVRFADGDDVSVCPETARRVALRGWSPDAVLDGLGIARPDGVELEVVSRDLGQGETETCYRYQRVDADRSILVEEVKNEIYDGTPYSTYVRGVVIDDGRGLLLTGSGDNATVTEG